MTENNRPQDPEICNKDTVFCCPNCGAPLGTTDGREFIIGAVIVRESIKLVCIACQQPYEWRPASVEDDK